MRVLCLAFLFTEYPQLLRKMDAQARGLSAQHECRAYVFGSSPPPPAETYTFTYVRMPWVRALYFAAASALIRSWSPDIVYFRYPLADKELLRFVQAHPYVVFEHNTIEEAELQGHARHEERRYGARVVSLAAGLCCVTEEILRYERARAGRSVPGMVMGNGITLEHCNAGMQQQGCVSSFASPDDAVHMLCAAHFAPWHGLDRLLHGMKAHGGTTPFVLHLAGQGPELGRYALLAKELGITDQVRIHGFCDRAALGALTARCHVAIGALGLHRTALHEAASIKLREYCVQGIPFILSVLDPDFDPLPAFARSIPNDDSPVDMRVVLELAQAVRERPGMRDDMRRYAVERLDWRAKTRRMAEFFTGCVRHGRPRPQESPLWRMLAPHQPEENGALLETLCCREAGVARTLAAQGRVARMPQPWLEHLQTALEASPQWGAGHLWRGLAHEARGDVRQALAVVFQ